MIAFAGIAIMVGLMALGAAIQNGLERVATAVRLGLENQTINFYNREVRKEKDGV